MRRDEIIAELQDLFAKTRAEFERSNAAAAAKDATIAELRKERDELLATCKDWEDDYINVIEENCKGDEMHCSCVPYLRRQVRGQKALVVAASDEVKALRERCERLEAALDKYAVRRSTHSGGYASHTCNICEVDLRDDTAQYRQGKDIHKPHADGCLLAPTNQQENDDTPK